MIKIKSFSVEKGDMFYIKHDSSNFTVIDCNLIENEKIRIMDEICKESEQKEIRRFISTHPDEDHIHGLEYFDSRCPIRNFYCVQNSAKKENETESFKHYCKLRDDAKKAFYLYRDCSRKFMNESGKDEKGNYIGSSGITILWPILENNKFKESLDSTNAGDKPNNISPIIKYEVENGITVLWFGDLEHHFMESIQNDIKLPSADIVFAPHHGRYSGAVPQKWLEQIAPKVIILGQAPSEDLKYFDNYNQITQNTAKDITIINDGKKIHFYSSNPNYKTCKFLNNEDKNNTVDGYYIGTLNL